MSLKESKQIIKTNGGGRTALRGFWYQILYSVLRTTYVELSEYPTTKDEICARFVYEGYGEEDIIISYPDHEEIVQIKSRRRKKNNYWRIYELLVIFKELYKPTNRTPNKAKYTFVTDGELDRNCHKFKDLCLIIKKLKDANQTNDNIISILEKSDLHFCSKSSIFGKKGLRGDLSQLFEALISIYNLSGINSLFEMLSKFSIIESYSESFIEEEIKGMLKYYIPNERIKSVINLLVAEIIRIAKCSPRKITREDLFARVGVPNIPLVNPIIQKSCMAILTRQTAHNRELIIEKSIRRPMLEKKFSDFFSNNQKDIFLLIGNSGVGKTISCVNLAFKYSKSIPIIYIDAKKYIQKDPIDDFTQSLSLELGRSDKLQISHIVSSLDKVTSIASAKFLIFFDGIDSLPLKRFKEIQTSLLDNFCMTKIKILYSCRIEKYKDYSKLIVPTCQEMAFDQFRLKDYNIHEFLDALTFYGFGVSKYDDLGNHNLYVNNVHLHKPLYLSIFSKLQRKGEYQYAPSLGVGLIFEVYLYELVSVISQNFIDLPKETSLDIIWQILVTIATNCGESENLSASDIHKLVIKNFLGFDREIYSMITMLLNAGIIYEECQENNNTNINSITRLISNKITISLFHEEIREWILAFNKVKSWSNKPVEYVFSKLNESTFLKKELLLAFGIIYHSDPSKYQKVVVKLLVRMESPDKVCSLLQLLDTPSIEFINSFLKKFDKNNITYYDLAHSLYYIYFNRGVESNAMSLNLAAIKAFNAASEMINHINLNHGRYSELKCQVLNNIGVSYKSLKKIKKAADHFQEAIKYHSNWHSYFNLAMIEYKRLNYNRAIEIFDQALLSEKPIRRGLILQTLNTKAVCLFRIGKIGEACSIWKDILSQSDCIHIHLTCQVNSNLGDGLFRLHDYSSAKKCFSNVVELDPELRFETTTMSIVYLIATYLKLGNINQAEVIYDRYRHLMNDQDIKSSLNRFDLLEFASFYKID